MRKINEKSLCDVALRLLVVNASTLQKRLRAGQWACVLFSASSRHYRVAVNVFRRFLQWIKIGKDGLLQPNNIGLNTFWAYSILWDYETAAAAWSADICHVCLACSWAWWARMVRIWPCWLMSQPRRPAQLTPTLYMKGMPGRRHPRTRDIYTRTSLCFYFCWIGHYFPLLY